MGQHKRPAPFEMGANLGSGWSSDNKEKAAKTDKILATDRHALVIKTEKRKGKQVTLIGEFFQSKEIKKEVLGDLKRRLSTGGSVKDEWIELQGDFGAQAREILKNRGYPFKN